MSDLFEELRNKVVNPLLSVIKEDKKRSTYIIKTIK